MYNSDLKMIGRSEQLFAQDILVYEDMLRNIIQTSRFLIIGASASVDFYSNVIAPYKGALEEWFVSNKSLYIYFVVIFVTAWAALLPSTEIAWRVFKDLPEPPTELKQALNYTD